MDDEGHEFDVEYLLGETDDAWHLELETGDRVWLPKSQVVFDDDAMVVTVPNWLASDRELV